MNGIVDTLNNLLASAQAITDVTQYNLYARICDYIDYVEKEPSLQVQLEEMDKNVSLHESLNKLKELKEVIDAPDVLLDGWEKEKGLDTLQAIRFALRHGGIKSLKNRSTETYNKKREAGLKSEDYKGHLANIHYALLRILKKDEYTKGDNIVASQKPQDGSIKVEIGQEQGLPMGFLTYKNKSYRIANPLTRQFRLLQSLTDDHLGVQKTLDIVYNDIRLEKEKASTRLFLTERFPKVTIIKNTLREINKALRKSTLRLGIKFFDGERSLALFIKPAYQNGGEKGEKRKT